MMRGHMHFKFVMLRGHMNVKFVMMRGHMNVKFVFFSIFFTHMNVLHFFYQRVISFSNYDILYWEFGKNCLVLDK
jgi:hypothetical protein